MEFPGVPKRESPHEKGNPPLGELSNAHPNNAPPVWRVMAIGSEMLVPGEEVKKGGVREVSAE